MTKATVGSKDRVQERSANVLGGKEKVGKDVVTGRPNIKEILSAQGYIVLSRVSRAERRVIGH